MKYRKKPMIIEAFQYDGDLKGQDGKYYVPEWAIKAFEQGILHFDNYDGKPSVLSISTLAGIQHVYPGDYIIRGVEGDIYAIEQCRFERTYEEVVE